MKRALLGLVLVLLVPSVQVPVFASDAVTVDMTTVLRDENGHPAKDALDCTDGKCPVLTLGRAASHALFARLPEDEKDPAQGDHAWARGVLAQRIRDDKAAKLSAEEISVIKQRLGEAYGAVIIMQAYPMIDPGAPVPALKK